MGFEITVQDFSNDVISFLHDDGLRALEKCGQVAEGYAKRLCPVNTGALRNSITHRVVESEMAVYIGTNMEYGLYVELGTGKYYPGGRRGWWVYVNGNRSNRPPSNSVRTYTFEEAKRVMAMLRSEGLDAHMTEGQPAKPFIKPAIADHVQQYQDIITKEIGGR